MENKFKRKPEWLKVKSFFHNGISKNEVVQILKKYDLNTVCNEAACPNRGECYGRGTATFMLLGRECTRNCRFCNVGKEEPEEVNLDEPLNVAKAVKELGLKYIVVTSVTRDDLKDGGAGHFAKTVKEIRDLSPDTCIEILIPDFKGEIQSLNTAAAAIPDVISHNVETVPSLYSKIRPMAVYGRSLNVLKEIKNINSKIYTKSGIMLGLGEKKNEVISLMEDLRNVNCDFFTIGQYLQPSKKHCPVIEYIHPDMFDEYRNIAYGLGFRNVVSAPLARSSYKAEEILKIFDKEYK